MTQSFCLPVNPSAAVLESVCRVLRTGIPGVPELMAYWPERRENRASNHFLFPDGTCLVCGESAEVETPWCVVFNDADSVPRYGHDRRFWDVPVAVRVCYDRALAEEESKNAADTLCLLLCGDLMIDNRRVTAAERLSAPGLVVRALHDVDCTPVNWSDGVTLLDLTFTAFCSAARVAS